MSGKCGTKNDTPWPEGKQAVIIPRHCSGSKKGQGRSLDRPKSRSAEWWEHEPQQAAHGSEETGEWGSEGDSVWRDVALQGTGERSNWRRKWGPLSILLPLPFHFSSFSFFSILIRRV